MLIHVVDLLMLPKHAFCVLLLLLLLLLQVHHQRDQPVCVCSLPRQQRHISRLPSARRLVPAAH
jgi:hypothetical protein